MIMGEGAIRSIGKHKGSWLEVFKDMRAVDLTEEMIWSLVKLNERKD